MQDKTRLVLTRRIGETVVIDGPAEITVSDVTRGKVRLAIVADRSTTVDRKEVHVGRRGPDGREAA
jgi:carbon storage regulator CsrA